MAYCKNLCEQYHQNTSFDALNHDPLEVDPDIVGKGVVAAFLVSALVTCGAIIFGYLSDSLPDSYFNEADKAIITSWQDSKISKLLIPFLYRLYFLLKSLVKKCLWMKSATGSGRHLTREKRTEALSRFILSLSDQQLVTGLAILIAALTNRCLISFYEFNIVISLAWFSSTTHLATLDVLQEYLVANPVIRNWRVLGMVSLMAMLLFGLLFQGAYFSTSKLPLQCAINEGPKPTIASILVLIYLVIAYISRILPLYAPAKAKTTLPEWLGQKGLKLSLSHECRRRQISPEVYDRMLREVLLDNTLRLRFKWINDLRIRTSPRNISKKSRDYDPVYSFATTDYYESFLSQFPFLFFGISSGITQVVTFRWFLAPKIKSNANQMGFGQIMPLLLLALPILAAAEIYYESRQRFESSRQTVDIGNSHSSRGISGRTDSGTNRGSPIQIDPTYSAPSGQNDSRSEHLNDWPADRSATINEATSRQLSLAMISTDVLTLYKNPRILGLLQIQFLYFSLLMIGAGISMNFVGFFSATLLCTVSALWLIPHMYKVSSYMGSVRTQLQAQLRKVSSGSGAPNGPDTASITASSRRTSHFNFTNEVAQIPNPPTATETASITLADQSNTISAEGPEIKMHRTFSEGNSITSPPPASPAPSLDIADQADPDRQVGGPGHIPPEDDDHTYSQPERQDTEADLGVLPHRRVPTSESSSAVSDGRARSISIHKWPRLEGLLQSALGAGRRRQKPG